VLITLLVLPLLRAGADLRRRAVGVAGGLARAASCCCWRGCRSAATVLAPWAIRRGLRICLE